MAVRFYDTALVEKIKKWTKDPNLRILKPDETTRLLQMRADMNDDKPIKLPIIAISRDKTIEILNTQKQPKTFSGKRITTEEDTDDSATVSYTVNAIPIRIQYQVDIYTKNIEEADEYVRNLVFNFINLPKLKVTFPYNGVNFVHISNIWIDSNIIDNSDIQEHLFPDQFQRFTLTIYVDDAYLFSFPIKEPTLIESVEMAVKDRYTGEIVEVEEVYDIDGEIDEEE